MWFRRRKHVADEDVHVDDAHEQHQHQQHMRDDVSTTQPTSQTEEELTELTRRVDVLTSALAEKCQESIDLQVQLAAALSRLEHNEVSSSETKNWREQAQRRSIALQQCQDQKKLLEEMVHEYKRRITTLTMCLEDMSRELQELHAATQTLQNPMSRSSAVFLQQRVRRASIGIEMDEKFAAKLNAIQSKRTRARIEALATASTTASESPQSPSSSTKKSDDNDDDVNDTTSQSRANVVDDNGVVEDEVDVADDVVDVVDDIDDDQSKGEVYGNDDDDVNNDVDVVVVKRECEEGVSDIQKWRQETFRLLTQDGMDDEDVFDNCGVIDDVALDAQLPLPVMTDDGDDTQVNAESMAKFVAALQDQNTRLRSRARSQRNRILSLTSELQAEREKRRALEDEVEEYQQNYDMQQQRFRDAIRKECDVRRRFQHENRQLEHRVAQMEFLLAQDEDDTDSWEMDSTGSGTGDGDGDDDDVVIEDLHSGDMSSDVVEEVKEEEDEDDDDDVDDDNDDVDDDDDDVHDNVHVDNGVVAADTVQDE